MLALESRQIRVAPNPPRTAGACRRVKGLCRGPSHPKAGIEAFATKIIVAVFHRLPTRIGVPYSIGPCIGAMARLSAKKKWFLIQEINDWIREQTGNPNDGLTNAQILPLRDVETILRAIAGSRNKAAPNPPRSAG